LSDVTSPGGDEAALEAAVPGGWSWRRSEERALRWRIEKTDIDPGEWPNKEYSLLAPEELQAFVLTYGNTDIGALSEDHCLINAKLIDAYCASRFGLDRLLRRAFAQCAPNEWGYT
jgi:hypothetical protein